MQSDDKSGGSENQIVMHAKQRNDANAILNMHNAYRLFKFD